MLNRNTLLNDYQELNINNYSHDDVAVLINWANQAYDRLSYEQAQAVEPARYIWNQYFDLDNGRGWVEVCKNYDPRLPEYSELHGSVDWSNTAQVRDFTVLYTHPAPPATGERSELIKELRLLKYHVGESIGDIVNRAADMLEADTNAQQVAVPVPMTDVEIYVVARNHPKIGTLVPHLEVRQFARAIEAHHKIGAKP